MKSIFLTAILLQAIVAHAALDQSFVRRTVGTFKLIEKESTEGSCLAGLDGLDSDDLVMEIEYISAKKAILGNDCGAVLWASGANDPMGKVFCRADSPAVQRPIKIDYAKENKEMDWTLTASEAGRVGKDSLKLLMEAKNNRKGVAPEDVTQVEEILKLTEAGVDIVSILTKNDGSVETVKCVYYRKK